MNDEQKPTLVTVREAVAIEAKQGVPYFVGISGRTAGARGISMQRVIFPPGGSARAHIHQGYETAIYILQGRVETRYGPGLRQTIVSSAGEFLYVPPDVPHETRNLSDSEPVIAVAARNIAEEQEPIILYDPASE